MFSHNLLLDQGLKSYADAVRKRIPRAEALDEHRVKFYFAPDISAPGVDLAGGRHAGLFQSVVRSDPENRRLDESRLGAGDRIGPLCSGQL